MENWTHTTRIQDRDVRCRISPKQESKSRPILRTGLYVWVEFEHPTLKGVIGRTIKSRESLIPYSEVDK